MAMMITKFHRLIQNKLLWVVFSVLVVISFVFWGTFNSAPTDRVEMVAPGHLYGKPVPPEVYQAAKFSTYLAFLLQTGQPIPYSSDLDDRISPLAWRRIAALDLARKIGLGATDEEVVAGLASQAFFQTNGGFDSAKYDAFINQDLAAMLQGRISKSQFEQHVREEITLNKLRRMVQQTVLVPPGDVKVAYHLFNDRYRGAYALVNPMDVSTDVSLSDEDVQAFFDADPEAFTLPEQVRVKYVFVPASNYVAAVTISSDRIQSYYDENLEQFQVLNTNVAADVVGEDDPAEAEPEAVAVTYRPLEDVREEITGTLAEEAARRKAVEVANELVYGLTPDQFGKAPTFDELAADLSLTVQSMSPFAASDPLPALGTAAQDFKAQAVRLFPNPEEYFSNPVTSEDGSYVLALEERIPPRVPSLEEVRSRVADAAREDAIQNAISERAAEVRIAMEDSDGTVEGVSDALDALELVATETDWFSATNGLDGIQFARDLRDAVIGLNPGEVSEPIPAYEGAAIFVLLERDQAEEDGLVPAEDMLAEQIERQYAGGVVQDWETYLLSRADFQERSLETEETVPAESDTTGDEPGEDTEAPSSETPEAAGA